MINTPTYDRRLELARLQGGDAEAFARLHADQHGTLSAVARRYLSNEADVEDAVQEAFLSAYRAIDRFDGRAAVSTWLHAITVNAARMRLRSMRRQPRIASLDATDASGERLPSTVADERDHARPAELTERAERRRILREALPDLPSRYREVIALRDLEQLDTRETADVLGTTTNAVKVRLHRARRALRELLEERGVEGLAPAS